MHVVQKPSNIEAEYNDFFFLLRFVVYVLHANLARCFQMITKREKNHHKKTSCKTYRKAMI